ncbi:MAG: RsmE family RNA methyltransferase [Pseudomonadota bacterium]
MPFHFHIPTRGQPQVGQDLVLDSDRSNYVTRVLRIRKGEQLRCFDGAGLAFRAELMAPSTRDARLRVVELANTEPMLSPSIALGLSMIKGPGQDRAIASATELGAQEIYLLNSDRSNVRLNATRQDNKLSHWQKVAISATEQCGRLHVPQVHLANLDELLANRPPAELAVLDASGGTIPTPPVTQDRLILIGPEGGWSEKEMAYFKQSGVDIWHLGQHTLRAETAPAVVLALLQIPRT